LTASEIEINASDKLQADCMPASGKLFFPPVKIFYVVVKIFYVVVIVDPGLAL
jgi:hypothetical protein